MSCPNPTNSATITSNAPPTPVHTTEAELGGADPCGTIPKDSSLQSRGSSQSSDSPSGAVKRPIHQIQSVSGSSYPSLPSPTSSNLVISCRFCNLSFQSSSTRIYEEHVSAHLKYECPVCDKIFPRNCSQKFEDHVQSHLMEEEEQQQQTLHQVELKDAADPVGGAPWGSHLRTAYMLDID